MSHDRAIWPDIPGAPNGMPMTALLAPRLWLRVAALGLLAAALFAPPLRARRRVYDVIVVLDITGSMNTVDQRLDGAPASRLRMEKRAVHVLLAALPCGSRLGLGIFVEKVPFLLFRPVETCANFSALDAEISQIDWRMGWDSESHIADALLGSIRIAAAQGADLMFITDGQESPPLWWTGMPNFTPVRDQVAGVVMGAGGHTLTPIPKFDSNARPIGFYKPGDVPSDPSGMFAGHGNLSAVDEPHLRQLAALSGLAYRPLAGANSLLPALRQTTTPLLRATTISLAPYLAAGAVGLLFLGDLMGVGRSGSFLKKRTKKLLPLGVRSG